MLLRRISISFLFLFLIKSTLAQAEFLDEITNWLGNWEGSYTLDKWNNKESVNIAWVHKNRWLDIEITGQANDDPRMKYSESIIVTANRSGDIVGFYIDENGYESLTQLKGKFDENRITLQGKSEIWVADMTWERKEGKLYKTISGKDQTVQVIFTKKE